MTVENDTSQSDDFDYARRGIRNAGYKYGLEGDASTKGRMTWAEAFEIVINNSRMSSLTFVEVCEIKFGALECNDSDARMRFLERLSEWQAAQWPRFRNEAVLQAISRVGRRGYGHGDLDRSIFEWPQLRAEIQVRQQAIHHALTTKSGIEDAIADLALFDGTIELIRPVLDRVVAAKISVNKELLLRLIESWTGATPWGRFFGSLLSDGAADAMDLDIADAIELFRQLPMDLGTQPAWSALRRLSGATRTAWRALLSEAVGIDQEVRDAMTEAVLWLATDAEDKFAQLTALHLNVNDAEGAMRKLTHHPSLRVRMRARSARELAAGTRDPVENLLIAPKEASVPWSSRLLARTWLDDPRLEQLLINGFSKATESLADEVRATASAGEETLVAKLFERLKNSVEDIGRMTKVYARETDRREYLHITLDHRFIGKREEGAEGLNGSSTFSTDVTLVMKATRPNGKVFAERSVFLQAKRMYRGKSEGQGEHYEYHMPQVRDLAVQSSSSFLVSVGPRVAGVTIPVMPAQLFLDRFDDEVTTKRLDIATVGGNSRSFAEWLVDDVIGLWTGDPSAVAVNKARTAYGDTPTLLVELQVRFVSVGRDEPVEE
ncbi:hypothetical protein [Rhizobium leguminosarum]|uniref:hypothetical protein n=1 Tax=Rhizobium leguminosarum TaxID=384 RepID=UPI000DE38B72|nr:hypothetical protein [Rhizobium leguminosarum]TCA08586.1 hypothetical protein E0H63_07215 [Rhizobium leguminosarum bv. viciae]